MAETQSALPAYNSRKMNKSEIISYDALWASTMKCKRSVSWKPSVKAFDINAATDVLKMHVSLEDGTWKNGKPKEIKILYPKRRDGLSIPFRDRVYQRSINDNVLYPEMVKHFIFDNCACQKGKGTSFARRRLKEHLWNYYTHHGNTGYILQIDITGYYPNMRHDAVKSCFRRRLNDDVYEMVCGVLDDQYISDVGYSPGSQMVQIAGISLLNDIDHFVKERLKAKYYLRYMDDFLIISCDREYLEHCRSEIEGRLNEIGFKVSEKKTVIKPLSDGFRFLGFDYSITETGKIIMTLNSENVKHERRKLRRMVQKFKRGEMSKQKIQECYQSWRAFAAQGDTFKLLSRMDKYLNGLLEVEENVCEKN